MFFISTPCFYVLLIYLIFYLLSFISCLFIFFFILMSCFISCLFIFCLLLCDYSKTNTSITLNSISSARKQHLPTSLNFIVSRMLQLQQRCCFAEAVSLMQKILLGIGELGPGLPIQRKKTRVSDLLSGLLGKKCRLWADFF